MTLAAVGVMALAVAVVIGVLLIRTHCSGAAQSPRAAAADPQALVHAWPGQLASPRLAALAADDTSHRLSTPWALLMGRGVVRLAQPLGDRTLQHVALSRNR